MTVRYKTIKDVPKYFPERPDIPRSLRISGESSIFYSCPISSLLALRIPVPDFPVDRSKEVECLVKINVECRNTKEDDRDCG